MLCVGAGVCSQGELSARPGLKLGVLCGCQLSSAPWGFDKGEEVTTSFLEELIPGAAQGCCVTSRATWSQPLGPQRCFVFSFRPSSSPTGRMRS